MTANDHRQMAAELLNLVQLMEQILQDYCRLLTDHDDGHRLEKGNHDEPF